MSFPKSQIADSWLPKWLSFLSGIPEVRRRKRLLAMIQAYIDETGNDGKSPVFLFSSLIAEAERWAAFSDEWDACLTEIPRILYFKMDEAVGKNGQFYKFSNGERDDKLRKLCAILNKVAPHQISTILDLPGFNNTWGKTGERPLSEPYFFPFHVANISVAFEVVTMGSTQPCEIFYDEHPIFGPRAKSWYPILRAMQPDTVRAAMPIEPFFRSDKDVLPLQAADLVAWIERQYQIGGLGEFAWVDLQLDRIVYSALSQTIDEAFIRNHFMISPEDKEEQAVVRRAALLAYEQTFGHQFPPKTKADRKRMQGRSV